MYRAPKIASGMPRSRTATATAAIVACSTRARIWLARPDLEAEAETAHGRDVARCVRVVAELAAQPRHVHVERLGGADRVRAPDVAHQRVPDHHGAGVLHEDAQQVELLCGQVQLAVTLEGSVRGDVDADVLRVQLLLL